jgi:cell wall-associated NlpC family hydrolase
VITVAASLALAGCGSVSELQNLGKTNHHANRTVAFQAHPQVVEPVAGATPAPPASPSAPSSVSVSGDSHALAQPVSLETIKQELASSGLTANQDDASLTAGGLAIPPVNAPQQVQEMIDAGNEIAHLPYIWGGGHETFIDTGYDCSGSISFILAAAGLLDRTETSGELETYGDPGPGKWVTIFATNGHTFAYIAGLRFDTVALAETGSRWSNRSADEPDLGSFVERHPPGL